MAAVNLSTYTKVGQPYTKTGVGTTWQEFLLPAWCTHVTVTGESQAIYVATVGDNETPADGGAVGTHRFPYASGAIVEVSIKPDPHEDQAQRQYTYPTSIFVAAQASTTTVSLWLRRAGPGA